MLEPTLEGPRSLLTATFVIGCLTGAAVLLGRFVRGPRILQAGRAGEMTAEQAVGLPPDGLPAAPIVSVQRLLAIALGSLAAMGALMFFFGPVLSFYLPYLLLGVMTWVALRTGAHFIRQSLVLSNQGLAGREAIALLARSPLAICYASLLLSASDHDLVLPVGACVLLCIGCMWIAFETSSSALFMAGLILGPWLILLTSTGRAGFRLGAADSFLAALDAAMVVIITVIGIVLITLARAPALPATRHPDVPAVS